MLRFANKLRSAGRLLELVVIPGSKHASVFLSYFLHITTFVEDKNNGDFLSFCFPGGMMPEFSVWKVEREAWRVAINEYLVKN